MSELPEDDKIIIMLLFLIVYVASHRNRHTPDVRTSALKAAMLC